MLAERSHSSGHLAYVVAAGCIAGYAACFAMFFATHIWILDSNSQPIVNDFVSFWTAGQLALHGHAASAYDPVLRHIADAHVVGHEFKGYLDWAYPPTYFFVVAALAKLPYTIAFLTWVMLSLALYGLTAAAVANTREAVLIALAAPWILADLQVGQNGFLTAALVGVILLNLETRPVLAGIVLGLLTYKPQFGLLFPIALAAGGYWRPIAWASVTACLALALSCLVFGGGALVAFAHNLPFTSDTVLTQGGVSPSKLQSVWGIVRWAGGSLDAAWSAQIAFTLVIAGTIAWLWRSELSYPLKATSLCAGVLLATPYAFAYDLPTLTIAIAFLYRDDRFDKYEYWAIAFSIVCFIAILFFVLPAGPLAVAAVGIATARRIKRAMRADVLAAIAG
jgi:arabinofuranan 3-O-arabinosyltransferase